MATLSGANPQKESVVIEWNHAKHDPQPVTANLTPQERCFVSLAWFC